eukprot:PITA_33569
MKGIFLPKDYQIALHRQVQNLRKKGMTVREYTEEFYQDEISILSPKNIEEAYKSAVKAEEKITRKQNARRGWGTGRGRGQSYGRERIANNSEEGSSSKTPGTAEKGDNTRGERPYQRGRGNGRGRGAAYQCYRCHKWGHRSFECLEAEQASQRGVYVAQPEEVEAPPQKEENVSETGEGLVLNKVLLKLAKEIAGQIQRKALFRTVFEFYIGRYKDKVVCDIMPMDVCHILLGRPWQYDRKAVHDGKTNCYKFIKDGIKHTLVPIKSEETTETSRMKVPLMGGKQFLKQIKDSEVNYVVVRREKTVLLHTEMSDLLAKIQKTLQEFSDIVVGDLPDKYPPKRSISHHIDFIPKASLLNKVAYRMSPKDNEEIRK